MDKELAVLTPVVVEASCQSKRFKYGNIARILGGMTTEDYAVKIRSMLLALDLECTLSK